MMTDLSLRHLACHLLDEHAENAYEGIFEVLVAAPERVAELFPLLDSAKEPGEQVALAICIVSVVNHPAAEAILRAHADWTEKDFADAKHDQELRTRQYRIERQKPF